MADVFISHSSLDAAAAADICRALESAGHACWIAPRNVTHGRSYAECIVEAITASRVVVVLLSANANASEMVMREVENAARARRALLPVRLTDVAPSPELQFFISRAHYLEAFALAPAQLGAQVEQAVRALLRLAEAPPTSVQPPAFAAAAHVAPAEPAAPPASPGSPPEPARPLSTTQLVIGAVATIILASVLVPVLTRRPGPAPSPSLTPSPAPAPAPSPLPASTVPEAAADGASTGPTSPSPAQAADRPSTPPTPADPAIDPARLAAAIGLTQLSVSSPRDGAFIVSGVVADEAELERVRERARAAAGDAVTIQLSPDAPQIERLIRRELESAGMDAPSVKLSRRFNAGPVTAVTIRGGAGRLDRAAIEAIARRFVTSAVPVSVLTP